MKKLLLLLLVQSFFITGCSTVTAGGAEITGLSLLNDRRTRNAILTDEAIENHANAKLNAYYDLRDKCHFNITAYNGAVLVTGETPKDDCMDAGGRAMQEQLPKNSATGLSTLFASFPI
ncbi:MAG: hypothetical protein Q7U66_09590 [Methylobacter sp.]|nr:hypothetical protein [Methylobacter sp.]